jgi:hypothetical protein
MLLFILHPAREIVTALVAVMLLLPVDIMVESNILAPFPTKSALRPPPVINRQRLIVPVKVPVASDGSVGAMIVQSINDPLNDEFVPKLPCSAVQFSNIPDATCPKLKLPDEHLTNFPLAFELIPVTPPNDPNPAEQSSNTPDA